MKVWLDRRIDGLAILCIKNPTKLSLSENQYGNEIMSEWDEANTGIIHKLLGGWHGCRKGKVKQLVIETRGA